MGESVKDLKFNLIELDDGQKRLVMWENGEIVEIFESDDGRRVMNHLLEVAFIHGFTKEKFRVRKP